MRTFGYSDRIAGQENAEACNTTANKTDETGTVLNYSVPAQSINGLSRINSGFGKQADPVV